MIIDTGMAQENWVLEGWRIHIEQLATLEQCDASRERLHRMLETNRDRPDSRGGPRDVAWIRDALGLIAERRQEIAVNAAMGNAAWP